MGYWKFKNHLVLVNNITRPMSEDSDFFSVPVLSSDSTVQQ